MKTSSTFLSKVLRSSDIYRPISMRFHDITYVDNPELSFYLLNKIKNKESNIKYLTHSLLKKIALFSIYYLSNLKNDNSKIKKIIISYRDPIERILSLYYYDIYYDFKRKKHDLLQLYFNEWLENSILKDLNIDKNDSRIIIINSNDVSNFIKSEFNIICNEKINSLSNNDDYYLTINKIKFTKKLITELYNSDPFNKRSIEDIYKIYGSKKGYDNLDFLIRD